MASRRKEPLKRRDSDASFFSPSVMALLLVLLFFVAFKVDDEGEFERFAAFLFCLSCFMVGVSLIIGLCTKAGIGVDCCSLYCHRRTLVELQCSGVDEAGSWRAVCAACHTGHVNLSNSYPQIMWVWWSVAMVGSPTSVLRNSISPMIHKYCC